jgi:acyl carrier protein
MESMKVLSIILKVEKKYGIELPDDATFRLETVGQFLDLVQSLRN